LAQADSAVSPNLSATPVAATNGFIMGAVTLDKEQRAVSFPATINQRTGIVEYAVVTTAGKTHESVFKTEAQPFHIHLGMLLLGARPANTNYRTANLTTPPGEPVLIEVSWKEDGRVVRRPLEDFIATMTATNRSLPAGPWAYNGSYMMSKTFIAQRDGSIISVHVDPDALVNNPRPGRENDDLHCVNTPLLPANDVPLEISLRLWSSTATNLNQPSPVTNATPLVAPARQP
jgi:hypothetical protein